MRTIYIIRVILVSVEAMILLCGSLIYWFFHNQFESFTKLFSFNDDILKYLMFMPVALAVWVSNEIRALLQEDNETIVILTSWNDYWKLKAHVWVSLGYIILFTIMSIIPWLLGIGVHTGFGLLLFFVSIIGQLYMALNIYLTRIRMKEIITVIKKSS